MTKNELIDRIVERINAIKKETFEASHQTETANENTQFVFSIQNRQSSPDSTEQMIPLLYFDTNGNFVLNKNIRVNSVPDQNLPEEFTKEDCELIIDAFSDEIKKCLIDGDKILLKNFMSFEVIERAEREGKNLNTGAPITYPSVKSIKCKVSKAFKDAVNEK